MTRSEPLIVTLIPKAKRADWMAGMDLPWPHRALLMWTPVDDGDAGIDMRLRRALWHVLAADDRVIGLPEQTGVSKGPLQWLLGQPGRAQFEMRWSCDAAAFNALLDESLFFATAFDANAPRPTAEHLNFWHDQGDPPATLFAPGQRLVIRSGVDGFCLGVFCSDASEFDSFQQTLSQAVEAEGGTLTTGIEPVPS